MLYARHFNCVRTIKSEGLDEHMYIKSKMNIYYKIDAKNEQRELENREWQNARRKGYGCLLYTSPSPRDKRQSRMPSSA